MANNKPAFPIQPRSTGVLRVTSDGTAVQTLFTAGANGSLVDSISVVSDDTSAMELVLSVDDGTTDTVIGEITIPINSGNAAGVPAVNALNFTDLPFLQSDGGLALGPTDILKIATKAALTATRQLDIRAYAGDY